MKHVKENFQRFQMNGALGSLLLLDADTALYQAKAAKRNRVVEA